MTSGQHRIARILGTDSEIVLMHADLRAPPRVSDCSNSVMHEKHPVTSLLVRQGIWAMATSYDLDVPALIRLAIHKNEALDNPIRQSGIMSP